MPQVLAQNALSHITLHGLLADSANTDMAVELHRTTPPDNLVRPWKLLVPERDRTARVRTYRDDFSSRPPSSLPPPTEQHLDATLGRSLGSGRSSVVYELNNISLSNLEPGTTIPSLVVKISRLDRVAWLAREAWFYDELERFQGSIIPYCFGWFEAELGELLTSRESPRCTVQALDQCPLDEEDEGRPWNIKQYETKHLHSLLAERDRRKDIISVLILERLGGMLPVGKAVTKESGHGEEIYTMHDELGMLGIVPWRDVRRENILRVLPPPEGAPSCPSPFHKRTYQWRLIDFEHFAKCNLTKVGARMVYGSQCVHVFVHVSEGWGTVYSDDEVDSDTDTSNADDK